MKATLKRKTLGFLGISCVFAMHAGVAVAAGDPQKGEERYRACSACHSLEPGRHMTGPSLAGIWQRQAGTVEGFTRYSNVLKQADVIWDEPSLDAWLASPRTFIPGNRMTFRGLSDAAQRRDIVAFLRQISERERPAQGQQATGMSAGMMRPAQPLNLKSLEPRNRVVSIGYCGDTYSVTTETGDVHDFWEFNLRFKTDRSENGPPSGHPVIISAGMRGDRASVVFASPAEISPFIGEKC